MRKIIVTTIAALLLAGGATAAFADPGNGKGPGPNGHNDYGLCTAAAHGNKTGWTDGALPPPFAGAPDGDDAGGAAGGRQDFTEFYCDPFPTPGGGE